MMTWQEVYKELEIHSFLKHNLKNIQIKKMIGFFALIAVASAATEYVSIEYNKGSYEIMKLDTCYCYKNECYKYTKKDANTVTEIKYTGDKCDDAATDKV